MDSVRVLVTGAGAPGIRGTLYSLKQNWENRDVFVIGVDMREDVVGRYLCDKFYQVPPARHEGFVEALLNISEREKVDVILPQVTAELFSLAKNKKMFKDIGTKIAVSSFETILKANNKFELLKAAKKAGIKTPEFYLVSTWNELEKVVDRLGFPFVVKPPIASGMRGFRVVYPDEGIDRKKLFFREKPDSSKITLTELHSILGDKFPELLVMEYLPGKEYSVDVLSAHKKVHAVIPRRRDVIRTGITFVGIVEKRGEIISDSVRITEVLGLEFAHGLQFKEDRDGVPMLIESNPRIQGTMVLSTIAGTNIIYGAVKLALDESVPEFEIRWGARLMRYWGGIGLSDDRVVEI